MTKNINPYQRISAIPKDLFRNPPQLTSDQKDELISRMRNASEKMREPVLKQAYEQGILTVEDYESKYKGHFYDDYGCDSFIQYLNGAMNAKAEYFTTLNERLIKRRDELADKFGLKIATLEEISALMEKEKKGYDA
jgi:predicted nucleic acid-binding protein